MNKRPTMLSATFVETVNVPGRYGDGRIVHARRRRRRCALVDHPQA